MSGVERGRGGTPWWVLAAGASGIWLDPGFYPGVATAAHEDARETSDREAPTTAPTPPEQTEQTEAKRGGLLGAVRLGGGRRRRPRRRRDRRASRPRCAA